MTDRPQKPLVAIIHRGGTQFAARDARLLEPHADVQRVDVRGPVSLWQSVLLAWKADAVLVWFASVHAVLPGLIARLHRRPFVIIPGGYEVAYVAEVGYGWQGSWPRRAFARWLLRSATTIIAVSPSISDLIRVAAPGVIPELAPNTVVPPKGNPLPPRDRAFDVASSIASASPSTQRNKGIDLILQAAALLPHRSFLLVGEVRRRFVPANVTVTGLLPPMEAESALGDARTYLQATRGYEAFGSAVLEAMARGTIPVVTEVGGMPWVVGGAGVVVGEGDASALAFGIERALESGLESRAHDRWETHFSPQRRVERLMTVLAIESRVNDSP